MRIKDL